MVTYNMYTMCNEFIHFKTTTPSDTDQTDPDAAAKAKRIEEKKEEERMRNCYHYGLEFLITFLFMYGSLSVDILGTIGGVSGVFVNLTLIYVLVGIFIKATGAHMNPGFTLLELSIKVINLQGCIGYIIMQFIGSVLACGIHLLQGHKIPVPEVPKEVSDLSLLFQGLAGGILLAIFILSLISRGLDPQISIVTAVFACSNMFPNASFNAFRVLVPALFARKFDRIVLRVPIDFVALSIGALIFEHLMHGFLFEAEQPNDDPSKKRRFRCESLLGDLFKFLVDRFPVLAKLVVGLKTLIERTGLNKLCKKRGASSTKKTLDQDREAALVSCPAPSIPV